MKRILLILFFISVMIGSIAVYATYFCTAKKYTRLIDSLLSDDCRTSIELAITACAYEKAGSYAIIRTLQKKFPVIKKIIVAYSPDEARITVRAHRPICLINDSFIFTCHNHVFSKNDFSHSVVAHIPSVRICQESMPAAPFLLSWAFMHLPDHFYTTHDLVITNKHCLRLIDKAEPQFSIVLSVDQHISPTIFAQCEQIKSSMIAQKNKENKNAAWTADIRFADYVIAYKT